MVEEEAVWFGFHTFRGVCPTLVGIYRTKHGDCVGRQSVQTKPMALNAVLTSLFNEARVYVIVFNPWVATQK